jgi:hypothetical protein
VSQFFVSLEFFSCRPRFPFALCTEPVSHAVRTSICRWFSSSAQPWAISAPTVFLVGKHASVFVAALISQLVQRRSVLLFLQPIKSAARVSPFWRLICAGLCFAPVLICSAWTCSSTPCSVPLGPLFLLPHKALILLFSSVISLLFNPRSYSRLLGCSLISCGSTSSGFFLR